LGVGAGAGRIASGPGMDDSGRTWGTAGAPGNRGSNGAEGCAIANCQNARQARATNELRGLFIFEPD
jgi:hypothetical protein